MWELDPKAGSGLKNWCFLTVILEKTLESPLDSKIKPVNPKDNQPWIFIERTDVEAETPILLPPDVKSWLTGKDPDAVRGCRQKEKRVAEGEMVKYCHRPNGRECEQIPGYNEGVRSLAYCSPWGHKESDMTQQLNNSNANAKQPIQSPYPQSHSRSASLTRPTFFLP